MEGAHCIHIAPNTLTKHTELTKKYEHKSGFASVSETTWRVNEGDSPMGIGLSPSLALYKNNRANEGDSPLRI